jgi:hypothetical protein
MFARMHLGLVLIAALIVSGCATPTKMAFENEADKVKNDKAVFLLTTTLKNGYKTSYQPKAIVLHVERASVKDSSDRLNFLMDDKAKIELDTVQAGNTYLVRMELEPGDYVIRGVTGFSGVFPVRGTFFAPLHAEVKATQPGVYYLGHVAATVRERQENEFRAGPPIPLVDQAVTGFSSGTFDVVVSDRFDQDEQMFKTRFPVLREASIRKAPLPPFDRAKAQKWWEAQ